MKKLFSVFILSLSFVFVTQVNAAKIEIDTKKSVLKWEGSKIIPDKHVGTLKLKSGSITFENSQPKSGKIVIDMTTIKNTDIKNKKSNAKLVGHLKNDDFFSVDKHPTAELLIEKVNLIKKKSLQVYGKLTIKGITKPISFIAKKAGNRGKHYKADIDFDRTDYNVRYGSGKFFDNLGDKVIKDTISIKADIFLKNSPKKLQKKKG